MVSRPDCEPESPEFASDLSGPGLFQVEFKSIENIKLNRIFNQLELVVGDVEEKRNIVTP